MWFKNFSNVCFKKEKRKEKKRWKPWLGRVLPQAPFSFKTSPIGKEMVLSTKTSLSGPTRQYNYGFWCTKSTLTTSLQRHNPSRLITRRQPLLICHVLPSRLKRPIKHKGQRNQFVCLSICFQIWIKEFYPVPLISLLTILICPIRKIKCLNCKQFDWRLMEIPILLSMCKNRVQMWPPPLKRGSLGLDSSSIYVT